MHPKPSLLLYIFLVPQYDYQQASVLFQCELLHLNIIIHIKTNASGELQYYWPYLNGGYLGTLLGSSYIEFKRFGGLRGLQSQPSGYILVCSSATSWEL